MMEKPNNWLKQDKTLFLSNIKEVEIDNSKSGVVAPGFLKTQIPIF